MCGVCWSSTSVLFANNAHRYGLHFIQEEPVAEGMKAARPFHLTPHRVLLQPWALRSQQLASSFILSTFT